MSSSHNPTLKATDEEIRRLCGYIKGDREIAAYFDIPIQRVSDVRAGIRVPKGERGKSQGKITESGDRHIEAERRKATGMACAGLLKALLRYGLRHDGLPGLPAERFNALAVEYGVLL